MIELPKEVKVYRCDHCNKISISKGAIKLHEICCRKNPINHTPCASCKYLEKRVAYKLDYYVDEDGCLNLPITEDDHGKVISTEELRKLTNNFDDYISPEPWFQKKTTMYCTKRELRLYHPKIRRMGLDTAMTIIAQCDMQMPTTCDDYQA